MKNQLLQSVEKDINNDDIIYVKIPNIESEYKKCLEDHIDSLCDYFDNILVF